MEKNKRNLTKEEKEDSLILKKINEFNNNGKYTIVIFCDTYYPIVDGVIKVLDNHAKNLKDLCNVVVVVPKHKNKTYGSNDYLVIGVGSMYFKFVNYDLAFPKLDANLAKYMRKLKIDLIHSHTPFSMGDYAVDLAKRRKIPIVGTFHSQYKQDFYKATKNNSITKVLLKNIMKVFNSYTETWTMHNASLKTLIDYGYKGDYLLIPNATEYIAPKNPELYKEDINKLYNLSKDENVFLFVGRLIEQKNILFIVNVLNELKKKNLKFKMFFVGDGPDEQKLKNLIDELKLNDDIILTGKLTDRELLSKIYTRADLFLFPSLYDVSSIVQIESACHKTPVAFIEGSVTSCNVTHNVNGYILENDVEKYANSIYDIISDKKSLRELSDKAFNDLYITWEDIAKKMFDRYLFLINKNNKLKQINKMLKNAKKTR